MHIIKRQKQLIMRLTYKNLQKSASPFAQQMPYGITGNQMAIEVSDIKPQY